MSEKKYLLTYDELDQLSHEWLDDDYDHDPEWLESHEYKERTCHLEWKPEVFAWVCSECDMITMAAPSEQLGYCPKCGAKVVER